MDKLKVAVTSICSSADKTTNIEQAQQQIIQAAKAKARWVVLPEVVPYIGPQADQIIAAAEPEDGPTNALFCALAKKLNIYLFIGMIEAATLDHAYNTLYVFSPQGEIVAKYRKIYLFRLNKEIDETKSFLSSQKPVSVCCDGWNVGLAICYDLRFPELCLHYGVKDKIDAMVFVAAFTYVTGKEHWEVLLRARAIETQCYVLAANQVGVHWGSRRSWGHSMVVSPNGSVLCNTKDNIESQQHELALDQVSAARKRIPVDDKRMQKLKLLSLF